MEKYFVLIFISIVFITCKKAKTELDVIGKWSLYSWQQGSSTGLIANATQFPCLSNNLLQINTNYTASTNYIGTDTCYVRQNAISSTWSRSGNDIYIGGEHLKISSSNRKLYLTTTSTITQGGTTPFFLKIVYVKE
ncbi:MAG TPA: hypothetical protein VIM16_10500 [Mucilaginibacter sp.]|jgi:hypothetical protein